MSVLSDNMSECNYMVFYIDHNNVMHFNIIFKSGTQLSGTDKKEKLCFLIEHYEIQTIEHI